LMIKHLDYLDERHLNYYFQFTLNDYDAEKLEPHVPNVQSRIQLSQKQKIIRTKDNANSVVALSVKILANTILVRICVNIAMQMLRKKQRLKIGSCTNKILIQK